MTIILCPFSKFDLNNYCHCYCLWYALFANYVESSTFTLVYKIHFDVNRPLVYEWGGGGGGMPCEQSSPQFVFSIFLQSNYIIIGYVVDLK